MSSAPPPRQSGIEHYDTRLAPLLAATSDDAAALVLETLLAGDVERVAREVVRRELSQSPAGVAYVDDVVADIRLRLMRKFSTLRSAEPDDSPIENVLGYTAVVAENACYAFLRTQYPERTRFRNRVRYAASHHPATTLAKDPAGVWRCQSQKTLRAAPAAGATQAFLDDPSGWLSRMRIDVSQPLSALMAAVVTACDRPVEFDRLVDALAAVLGIVDAQPATRREDAGPEREIADPAPNVGAVLEQRESLGAVWREIEQLLPRQRAALLLNLRDPEGGAVLHLLPATGVVSLGGIAAALEIDEPALASMWDGLPLDDLSIAAKLGLTRQQVINLRKAARARLARRLLGGK